MLNTSANKAVYGGAVPAVVYVLTETAKWAWPATASLFTAEYVVGLTTMLTALVVWLVPNKETSDVA